VARLTKEPIMALTGIEGKVAVVTGGAGGLGTAAASRLAAEGARLVLVDIDGEAAEAAAKQIGSGTIGVAADVSTEDGVASYVRAALDAHGRIDLFFNNAGIEGRTAPIVDAELEWFDRVIAINLRGVYLGLQHVLRVMRDQGDGGAIVNTSSVAGLRGFAGLAPYTASKHAVMGLTKTAAIEAAEFGVRVNAVNPGPISTEMMHRIEMSLSEGDDLKAVHEQFEGLSPMARYGTPEEVANLVAWLLSDEASYSSGCAYLVDGGLTAS
jgi:NAD(P)-dependent dehydrogenase (short-subunit alcohol dehydrogenase family)